VLLPWRISRLLLLGVLLLAWGCRPAAPATSTATSSTNQKPTSDSPPAEFPSANVTVDPGTPELELTGDASESAPIVEEQNRQEPEGEHPDAAPDPNPPEKLLLMTTAGPLRVDARVWVEGEPHPQAMQALLDQVLSQVAASDEEVSSGTSVAVTWEQLLDRPAIKGGIYGNLAYDNEADRTQILNRYDANRNGKVDPPELVRFLTRNRAAGRTFSIRPTAYAGDRQRESSPLWQWLDRDGDGRLDPSELAGVADRLRVADLNDDQLVTAEELQQARASTPVMRGREEPDPRRFQGSPAAYLLEEGTDWHNLLDGVERIYRFGGPASWSLLGGPQQLASLDPPITAEAQVRGKEMARIAEIPAEFHLELRLGEEDQAMEVRLAENATTHWEIARGAAQWIFTSEHGTVVFRVRDLPRGSVSEGDIEQLMAMADTDGNGYLTEEEFQAAPGLIGQLSFVAADLDGNEQLYPDEIRKAIEAQRSVEGAQVRIQALGGIDPLFWQLDENQDGRLSAREIAGASERLTSWVTRADQSLQVEQIPGVVIFEIYRGEDDPSPEPLRLAEPADLASSDAEDRPAWHQAMDSNNDGDVSRREFLGTDGQFQSLDRDSDGLISVEEAVQAKADSSQDGE